jgi:hypothetical protein
MTEETGKTYKAAVAEAQKCLPLRLIAATQKRPGSETLLLRRNREHGLLEGFYP